MACAEFEEALLADAEGALAAEPARELQVHLVACSGCREFRQRIECLEVQLERAVGRPVMSAGFISRLLEIPGAVAHSATATRETERLKAEADFQARIEALQTEWRSRRNHRIGALLFLAATLILFRPLIWRLLPAIYQLSSSLPSIEGVHPLLPFGWLCAAVALGWIALQAPGRGSTSGQLLR